MRVYLPRCVHDERPAKILSVECFQFATRLYNESHTSTRFSFTDKRTASARIIIIQRAASEYYNILYAYNSTARTPLDDRRRRRQRLLYNIKQRIL